MTLAAPALSLGDAKDVLIKIEEYQRQNLPRFCSALDLAADDSDLFKVTRWSAQDHLFKTYGLEIEELLFFIDFFDMYFGPQQIYSPLSPSVLSKDKETP